MGGVDERTRLDPSGWAGLENRAQHRWGADRRLRPGRADRRGVVLSDPPRRPPGVAQRHPRARAVAARRRHALVALGTTPDSHRLDARPGLQRPAPDARAVRRGARHRPHHLRRGRTRRARARPAPPAPARARRDRHAQRDRGDGRPPHRRRLDGRRAALGTALAVRRARRPPADRTGPDLGRARQQRGCGAPPPARAPTTPPGYSGRYKIVFARLARARARRAARPSSYRPGVSPCRARSAPGETRATQVLPAFDGMPPGIAVAVPVRPSSRRRRPAPSWRPSRSRPCEPRWPRTCPEGHSTSRSRRAPSPVHKLQHAKTRPGSGSATACGRLAPRPVRPPPGPRARHAPGRGAAHDPDRPSSGRRRCGASATPPRADRDPACRARPRGARPPARRRSARACSPRPPPT